MNNGLRLALLGVIAGLVVAAFFGLLRLAYPGTPGLGPSTPAELPPAPTGLGSPPASVLNPPRPADTSGAWVVDMTGDTECCDRGGRSFPTVYNVVCVPARELDADPPLPEDSRHYWEIPIPADKATAYTTGDPCPKPNP
jgi:hypothetical protein